MNTISNETIEYFFNEDVKKHEKIYGMENARNRAFSRCWDKFAISYKLRKKLVSLLTDKEKINNITERRREIGIYVSDPSPAVMSVLIDHVGSKLIYDDFTPWKCTANPVNHPKSRLMLLTRFPKMITMIEPAPTESEIYTAINADPVSILNLDATNFLDKMSKEQRQKLIAYTWLRLKELNQTYWIDRPRFAVEDALDAYGKYWEHILQSKEKTHARTK